MMVCLSCKAILAKDQPRINQGSTKEKISVEISSDMIDWRDGKGHVVASALNWSFGNWPEEFVVKNSRTGESQLFTKSHSADPHISTIYTFMSCNESEADLLMSIVIIDIEVWNS